MPQSPENTGLSALKRPLLLLGVMGLGLTLGYCTVRQSQSISDELLMSVSDDDRLSSGSDAMSFRPSEDTASSALPSLLAPDHLEPVFDEPYFPFLDDESHDHSVSVGTVTNGNLINAKILPLPGKTYDILPRQRARGLNYGSDEMIDLLTQTSEVLWRQHRRRLWLGNIGRRGGGDIPWSVSHNSGRDADIAFAYTNSRGVPVDPPDLVPVDKNGRSTTHAGAYHFDTKRTWTIVRALLTHRQTRAQYLFVSNPLKKKLIDHAKRRGEPRRLVERAEKVLLQPGYSSPHNDHLHLRIECSRKDIQGGCVHTGPAHAGVRVHSAALAERRQSVSRKLSHLDPELRARAIERLVLLRAAGRTPDIQSLLEDDAPRVRRAVARGLGAMGGRSQITPLIERFARDTEGEVMVAIIDALERLGGERVGGFLARAIADTKNDHIFSGPLPEAIASCYTEPSPRAEGRQETPDFIGRMDNRPVDGSIFSGFVMDTTPLGYSVRLAAIEAAARSERTEPVLPLIGALTHADPILRGRAARALRRLTNHSMGVAWDDPALTSEALANAAQAWRSWHESFAHMSRDEWLLAGFKAAGFNISSVDKNHIWDYVRAIPFAPHLSYNAQRILMDISDHRPRSLKWHRSDATWHWTRWFKRRRWKFRIGMPPADLIPYDK